MTRTVVFASICCVASFLLGASAHVNGNADEQQAATASPQRSFIGRYQMIASDRVATRIFDSATGKYVELQSISRGVTEWVEIDPIGNKITPERFAELKVQEQNAARLRAIKAPDKEVE